MEYFRTLFYTNKQFYALTIQAIINLGLVMLAANQIIPGALSIFLAALLTFGVALYQHYQEHTFFDFGNISKWAYANFAGSMLAFGIFVATWLIIF